MTALAEFKPGDNPTPHQVRAARLLAEHTQTEAAATIYRKLRGWQDWESGKRKMSAAEFELYLIKAGLFQARL